jgi:hypothetical protein
MQSVTRKTVALLLSPALLLALPAFAHINRLSPESVREAYFLGRSSDRAKVLQFLGRYRRIFTLQVKPSEVGTIEIFTPYQKVVQNSWSKLSYSSQQAEKDYVATGDTVTVRVYLVFYNNHPEQARLYADDDGRIQDHREDFWHDYEIHVAQSETLAPKEIMATPRYACCGAGLTGVVVDLKFNAEEFSNSDLRVEVVAPDTTVTDATFPLGQLK